MLGFTKKVPQVSVRIEVDTVFLIPVFQLKIHETTVVLMLKGVYGSLEDMSYLNGKYFVEYYTITHTAMAGHIESHGIQTSYGNRRA